MTLSPDKSFRFIVLSLAAVIALNLVIAPKTVPVYFSKTFDSPDSLMFSRAWTWGMPGIINHVYGRANINNVGSESNGGLTFEKGMLAAYPLGALDTQNPPLDKTGFTLPGFNAKENYNVNANCGTEVRGCRVYFIVDAADASQIKNLVVVKFDKGKYFLMPQSFLPKLIKG